MIVKHSCAAGTGAPPDRRHSYRGLEAGRTEKAISRSREVLRRGMKARARRVDDVIAQLLKGSNATADQADFRFGAPGTGVFVGF